MNLSDFFLPSSLAPRLDWKEQQQQGGGLVVRMPPRSAAKDVISAAEEVEVLGFDAAMPATTMDQWRSHPVNFTPTERVHSREKDRPRELLPRPSDITFYVGRHRAPFTVSAHTLKHSSYFASLLEKQRIPDPVVLDCDEATFHNLVLVLRYGSFEALPKMNDSELFRLKMELECYGIDVPSSSTSSQRQSVPKPRLAADFPDLPEELKDPSKLFLVARLDFLDEGLRCECTAPNAHTYWALSFHHRHTFCTACGRCPAACSPRHLAEMYMAAAMYYSHENSSANVKQKWSVGCDSTCSLKLLSAKPGCVCSCEEGESVKSAAWAVSTYYSHAFCTRCGRAADERTLIFILLTQRYGGVAKHSKQRRDHVAGAAGSEGATQIAPESRKIFANSETVRHYRGNRSM